MSKFSHLQTSLSLALAGAIFICKAVSASTTDFSDSTSNKIMLSKASVTNDRITSLSDPTGAAHKMNLQSCDVLAPDSDGHKLVIDCTAVLEAKIGRPMASTAIFTAERDHQGMLRSETFNCYVTILQTKTESEFLAASSGIGFFFQGVGQSGRMIPNSDLYLLERQLLPGGKTVLVHEFAALARCWAGSMTSSTRWQIQFKPFVYQSTQAIRYWDPATQDYFLNEANPTLVNSVEMVP